MNSDVDANSTWYASSSHIARKFCRASFSRRQTEGVSGKRGG